ncbi:hypothetical protein C2845_PM04G17180 [Panicum miliaceum]|uniref:Myb/SANT-like domain-containing protein n=1 Tax=Panicum miliaceum TaxID=4540 RepID=A0A3L6QPW6_PANMI|nr:hypothetical protein C2845_PM04G17180 [Panicum miliaceum]
MVSCAPIDLANRLSAARSKERKIKNTSKLERKVHTLHMEATTLSFPLHTILSDIFCSRVNVSITETAGTIFTAKQMSNKLQTLKKRYNAWKELQNSSGLGRNKTKGAVEADAEWWETHNGSQDGSEPEDITEAAEPRGAPPPYHGQLDILFGFRQDRGSFMWAGGIRCWTTRGGQQHPWPNPCRVKTQVKCPVIQALLSGIWSRVLLLTEQMWPQFQVQRPSKVQSHRAIRCARGKWPIMGRSLFARRIEML